MKRRRREEEEGGVGWGTGAERQASERVGKPEKWSGGIGGKGRFGWTGWGDACGRTGPPLFPIHDEGLLGLEC